MSLIRRHILPLSTLTGAIIGYAFLHPFGMIIHVLFHFHDGDKYLHLHWNEVTAAFASAFSLGHVPQSISYVILSGVMGYLTGKISVANKKNNEHLKTLSAIGAGAAGIVHDLRNPLGIVGLTVDLMETKSKDQESIERCKNIKKQIKHIANMISNIKMTAQDVGTIKLSKESVSLMPFLRDILSNMILKHKIELDIKYDGGVSIDKAHFERVFWNLLNNADDGLTGIEGGRIGVSVKRAHHSIMISISDNGHGIPRRIISNLFEAGNTYGKKGGSGLGLYTCKKIIEAHKGRIWIDSKINLGTTIFVNIPI